MKLHTIRALAVFCAFLVVLTPVAYSNEAAAISKSYDDGPAFTTEWSDSKYQDDVNSSAFNGSTDPIGLKSNSQSDTEINFGDSDSGDPDIGTTSDKNFLENDRSQGEEVLVFEDGGGKWFGGAAKGPDMWFVGEETGDASEDDLINYDSTTNNRNTICTDIDINAQGLAMGGNTGYDWVFGGHRDLSADKFFGLDASDCSTTQLATTDGFLRGIAQHPDDNVVYFVDGENDNLEKMDLSSGSDTKIFNLPSGKQAGLAFVDLGSKVRFFVSYRNDNTVKVFDGSGTKVNEISFSFTPKGLGWTGANSQYGKNLVVAEVDGSVADTDFKRYWYWATWSGDGSGTIKYSRTLTTETGISNIDLNQFTWTVDAPPSADGSGTVTLEIKKKDGNWKPVKTVSAGSTTNSDTFTHSLGSNFEGVDNLEYRLVYSSYKMKARGETGQPTVSGASWDYEWYSTPGTIESTKLNTQDVKSFDTVEVEGSSGGQGVQLQILDRNQTVVWDSDNHGGNKQPSATFDISDLSGSFSTEFVYVRVILETNGLSTPSVTGWRLNYEGNPSLKVIESAATVTKDNNTIVNDTSVTSEIGSTDTYYINETNQTVDKVTWKVNGQVIKTNDTDATGGYNVQYTWDNAQTGQNSVTAELSNRNGTTSHIWTVDIPQPATVKLGTVDIIKGETSAGASASENVTVDFPGDNQTITTDIGTQFAVSVDVSNENVTYNLTMSVNEPIKTSVTVTNITGDFVNSTLSDSLATDKARNFDGEYGLTLSIENTNNKLTTWDVRGIYKQQIADSHSTPVLERVNVPSGAHRGESFSVSAEASSEITSIREVWLRVKDPSGSVERRAIADYTNTLENESVAYNESIALNKTGNYEITVVGQNYDRINGTSRTFVVDVANSPPESQLLEPPTQVDANRSFRLDWTVSDPEDDAVVETGIYLVSPSGVLYNFTDDVAGDGQHVFTVGPGNATNPGLWAVKAWARDDKGGFANSSREIMEVVSLQEYQITNTSVALWNGTETSTLHAGREIQVDAEITPNVSSTLNATVYVNLETQSGTLVSELFTATSVTLKNGTTTNLTEINNGTVSPILPTNTKGSLVVEIGVVSDEGSSEFRIPVEVKGVTSGEIESTSLNKKSVFPPEFLTVVSTVRNDGEQTTKYNYTVQITQNGTTHVQDSVNTTVINPSDTASVGLGFQIPKTLEPGDYTVEVSVSSPNHTEWDVFDETSLPITVEENKQADVDKVDLEFESGVIQGFVTVENDGNVELNDGSLRVVVLDEDKNRLRVESYDTPEIAIGDSHRTNVNFNFTAEENSTYFIGLRYDDGNVTDDTFTQIATAPRPSMQIVDIDGPEEVIQGDNATYEIVVNNNGDVQVDSTSLVVRLQTGQGDTVSTKGIVVDTTFPGKEQTVSVELEIDDPALLGRSAVSVVGQAHHGNNTTVMLPRDEEIFVSAPGFIISGDSSFSDLTPGESFTVTETFLVVGRPDAAIDVQLRYDGQKVELISGEPNATITSGSSLSWTFLVKEPVNGQPIRIIAESASQTKAKDIAVSTTGSTGIIGNFDQVLPDSFDEFFPNRYMANVLPGYDAGVHYLLQILLALLLVAIIEFADITTGLTFLQKHGLALVTAGWTTGFIPEVMVVVSGVYVVGLWIESRYGLSAVA